MAQQEGQPPTLEILPSNGRGSAGRREEGVPHSKGFASPGWSRSPGTRPMQAFFTSSWARHELEEALPGTQGQE